MLIQRIQNHPLANRYTASYAIAVLLHLLMLILLTPARDLFSESSVSESQPNPLSFEFVESDARSAVEPPPDTRFRSDRNARSADQSTADLPKGPSAYSEGIVDFQSDFQTQRQSESDVAGQKRTDPSEQAEQGEESEAEQIYKGLESMAWLKRKGVTTQAQREQSVFGAPANTRQTVAGTNTFSRALDQGRVQLSTYDWNFAPYMKYVKRRIESNMFIPAAFSRLGIIEGESLLLFRIQRDGSMEPLEILDSTGSELLLKTTTQAVELSSPWKPLPADFPDPFLEINFTFVFVIE